MKALNLPKVFETRHLTYFRDDDFDGSVNAGYTTGGTAAIADAKAGVMTLTSGNTANNEAFCHLAKKPLKLDGPLLFGASVKFTEADGLNSSLAVGVSDQAGAGLIVNGGLTTKAAAHYGALFVKFLGHDYWTCVTSSGSDGLTVTATALTATNLANLARKKIAVSTGFQLLTIEVLDTYGKKEICFFVDGELVAKHDAIDVTNAGLMAPVLFVKTGSANAQVLSADYWMWGQKR